MMTATSFYGVEFDDDADPAVSTAELMHLFDILKPKALATPLIRIGGDSDGSYLVPDDLHGVEACFSPGVNRIKYFEDHLTDEYGIASHMCDFTCDVDEFKTPIREGKQTFLKKWLDVTPGEDNISLDEWVRANDVSGDLLLQMDIEGAEYRNLLGTFDETLTRFRVIVIEVHGLGRMLDGPVLRGVFAPFFEKLSRNFTTVHAHPNNCCGDFEIPGTDIRIPNLLELTLVRNDRFTPGEGVPRLPHPLDVSRNVAHKPPLFLSDAWCDYARPLESRVKMLEDLKSYKDSTGVVAGDGELASVLVATIQSIRTVARSLRRSGELVEVAEGQPYLLSSAFGTLSRTGVVKRSDSYFFHTDFGLNQSIRVDLGGPRRVRRIEVTNRRNGYQERARFLFVVLSLDENITESASVLPLSALSDLAGGGWRECSIDVPDIVARYVTVTTPVHTALHLADLRVYAAGQQAPLAELRIRPGKVTARRVLRSAKRRARRVRARLSRHG